MAVKETFPPFTTTKAKAGTVPTDALFSYLKILLYRVRTSITNKPRLWTLQKMKKNRQKIFFVLEVVPPQRRVYSFFSEVYS